MRICVSKWMALLATVVLLGLWTPRVSGQTLLQGPTPQANSDNPFLGAVPGTKAEDVHELSLAQAVDRGLRFNLGLLLSKRAQQQAAADKTRALSGLLPTVDASIGENVEKINFDLFGLGSINLNSLGLGSNAVLPRSVGPFSTSTASGSVYWSLLDLTHIRNWQASGQMNQAATATYRQARELVVVTVETNYLLAEALESQYLATKADYETAQALHKLAQDQEHAGLVPEIDTLRARTELQNRTHALLQAKSNYDKQMVALARVLGLPITNPLTLTTRLSYRPQAETDEQQALARALASRQDYQSAQAQLRALEYAHKAAKAEYLPSVLSSTIYGVVGLHPSEASPTWASSISLQIPIFHGGRTEADAKTAEINLKRQQDVLTDLKIRIAQEVHNAILDMRTAGEQVEAAQIAVQFADATLRQSQDRFANGVANNIEVIQAQQQLANAREQYVGSLYLFNSSRVFLQRATGTAEKSVADFSTEQAVQGPNIPSQSAGK